MARKVLPVNEQSGQLQKRPREHSTHAQGNDHAPPTANGADVSATTVCCSISISPPAPEYLIVGAELVYATVEVGEQHELVVGVQR